jgi:SAM-dependent methyltransferase
MHGSHDPAPEPVFCDETCACPVCGVGPEAQKPLFTKQRSTFVRCQTCAVVFINPRPSGEWLARRYHDYGKQYFTDPAKLASDFRSARYDYELGLLKGATGKLLDVGCATGSFVSAARTAGFDASGIDISAESTRYGREVLGLPLEVGDLWERQYPSKTFEVVTLWATLEHLPDPNRFLAEACRLLVTGGRIALSVPNYGSLTQRILGRRDRYVGIDHVNYFTADTLRRLLERHDFRAEVVRTDRFSPVVFWQDLRGATPEGASIERQLADMAVTDRVKSGRGVFAALRRAHGVLTKGLARVGLAELLYVVGRKTRNR